MDSALRLPPRPRLALAAFAAATVLVRAATLSSAAPAPDPDADAAPRIAAFLDGLALARRAAPPMAGATAMSGERGACRVTVAGLHLLGWQNDLVPHLGSDGDSMLYVFDGIPFAEPPVWAARAAFYADRVARAVGLSPPRPLLFGMVASPGCATDAMGFGTLRG